MVWYQYMAAFFSGAALANAVPHFIHGISGDKFPTPFAKPPGKGLSSPQVNILWAGFNIILGYTLWNASKINMGNYAGMLAFFVGAVLFSFQLSKTFVKKDKE